MCVSEASVLLALNRCLEMSRRRWTRTMFEGWRICVPFAAILAHAAYSVLFTTPFVYSTLVSATILNPHAGYLDDNLGQVIF